MSTPIQTFADKTADFDAVPAETSSSTSRDGGQTSKDTAPTRKKKQTPYKPVLSTIIKGAMEASVKDAIEAQKVMEEIVEWLKEERLLRDELRADISTLAPLDHRMQELLEREVATLLRIGKLENRIAKLALTITALERRLAAALANSRRASVPPNERATDNGSGGA